MDSKHDSNKLTLGHLLAKVSRLLGHRMRMKLESIGLHHAQGTILFQLWHQDGMPQNVLAHALHITPPTATNTLQRMERDGWIERHRDTTDQRIVRVYLTGKAKALSSEVRASFQALDRELTSTLTDKERSILLASLIKVHRHLSQESADSDPSCHRDGSPGGEGQDEGQENL